MIPRFVLTLFVLSAVACGPDGKDDQPTDIAPTDDSEADPTDDTDVDDTDVEPTDVTDVDPTDDTDVDPTDVDPTDPTDVTDVDTTDLTDDSDAPPTDPTSDDTDPADTDVTDATDDSGAPSSDTDGERTDDTQVLVPTDTATDDVDPTDSDAGPTDTDGELTDDEPTDTEPSDTDVEPTDSDAEPTDATDTDVEPDTDATGTDVEPTDADTDGPSDAPTDTGATTDTTDTTDITGPTDSTDSTDGTDDTAGFDSAGDSDDTSAPDTGDTASDARISDTGASPDTGFPTDILIPSDLPDDTDGALETTVPDIRQGLVDPGTLVSLRDVTVTGTASNGVYVQSAGGAWNGLFIYTPGQPDARLLEVGDVIDAIGTYQEYAGSSQIVAPAQPWTVLGRAVPLATTVSAVQAADVTILESLENQLITVEDITVTSDILPGNEYALDVGLALDDRLWSWPSRLSTGDTFTSITGILNFYVDYNIEPRGADDVVGFLPAPGGFDPMTPPMIVEIVDHATSPELKYVEIYNPWPSEIGLRGLTFARYSNGTLQLQDAYSMPELRLGSGDTLVLCNRIGADDFEATFGYPPAVTPAAVNGNGNDTYVLLFGTEVVDIFGQIGVDGTGTPWEYTDRVVKRNAWVTAATPVFDVSEWTFSTDMLAALPDSRE
jgi:hypothetical protein